MRPEQASRRSRRGGHGGGHGGGRGGRSYGGPRGGNNSGSDQPRSAAALRNQIFDSNGPDMRVRGNAFQVHEKYQALAKDALSSGDRVLAENYLQHAEHYYRIVQAINEASAVEQRARQQAYGEQPQYVPPAHVPPGYYGQVNHPQQQGAVQQQPYVQQRGGYPAQQPQPAQQMENPAGHFYDDEDDTLAPQQADDQFAVGGGRR